MNTPQDSMAEQLCELYAEREILEAHFPGRSAADLVEAASGVRPAEPLDHVPTVEATDSLESQLIDLYTDREILDQAFPGMAAVDIVAALTLQKNAA